MVCKENTKNVIHTSCCSVALISFQGALFDCIICPFFEALNGVAGTRDIYTLSVFPERTYHHTHFSITAGFGMLAKRLATLITVSAEVSL